METVPTPVATIGSKYNDRVSRARMGNAKAGRKVPVVVGDTSTEKTSHAAEHWLPQCNDTTLNHMPEEPMPEEMGWDGQSAALSAADDSSLQAAPEHCRQTEIAGTPASAKLTQPETSTAEQSTAAPPPSPPSQQPQSTAPEDMDSLGAPVTLPADFCLGIRNLDTGEWVPYENADNVWQPCLAKNLDTGSYVDLQKGGVDLQRCSKLPPPASHGPQQPSTPSRTRPSFELTGVLWKKGSIFYKQHTFHVEGTSLHWYPAGTTGAAPGYQVPLERIAFSQVFDEKRFEFTVHFKDSMDFYSCRAPSQREMVKWVNGINDLVGSSIGG